MGSPAPQSVQGTKGEGVNVLLAPMQCNEVVTVKAGRMRFTLLDQQVVLEPGDELYIPAGVPHSTKNIAATHTTWFYG